MNVKLMRFIVTLCSFTMFSLLFGSTIYSSNSNSLHQWIDAAEPFATIDIPTGVYEGPIIIDKPLTLRGTAGVKIVGTGEEAVISILADDVTLENIVVENEAAAETDTIFIHGNRVILQQLELIIEATSGHGITVRDSNDGRIEHVEVRNKAIKQQGLSRRGNGIALYGAQRWHIADNKVSNVFDAIYVENSHYMTIMNNDVALSRYGIHTMYSSYITIEHNVGVSNVTGAMIMNSENCIVRFNQLTKQNENVHSQGILLYDAHQSFIEHNDVEGNRVGIYVEESSANRIANNFINYNFIGVQMKETKQNEVRSNNFVANVVSAQIKNSDEDTILHNYWDEFQGIDIDGDGMSDTVYRINPFFQTLVQKRPAFQLLFEAPGILFLEQLYPLDYSTWAVDHAPAIQSYVETESVAKAPSWTSNLLALFLLLIISTNIIWMRRKQR